MDDVDLRLTVARLLQEKREGDYWDFKVKHHENKAKLLHDILCLANTVHHKGDRYLIFGVTDDYTVVGLETPKKQADLIDLLNKMPFAGGMRPDVSLRSVVVNRKPLDVLIIHDKPEKPYFLIEDKVEQGTCIRAGVVYSRIRDSNTPINGTASPADIEAMWRERFGLDLTPFERFQIYLADSDGWEKAGEEDIWHYKQFPEFTIEDGDGDKVGPMRQCWIRRVTNPDNASFIPIALKFHQTVLWRTNMLSVDSARARVMRANMAVIHPPELNEVTQNSTFSFDYFLEGSTDWLLHHLFMELGEVIEPEHFIKCDWPDWSQPVLVFTGQAQKESFVSYLRDHFQEWQDTSCEDLFVSSEIDKHVRERLDMSYKAKKIFEMWKEAGS